MVERCPDKTEVEGPIPSAPTQCGKTKFKNVGPSGDKHLTPSVNHWAIPSAPTRIIHYLTKNYAEYFFKNR